MQYFKTVQLYFKSIINSFDILALSEHCLFEEQHSLLKTVTDGAYNYHAASSCDNPCIAGGQRVHGGVTLLWRYSIDDFVSPIKNIDSNRIVGIKYELNGIKPLFILSVYLPSVVYLLGSILNRKLVRKSPSGLPAQKEEVTTTCAK